MRDLHQPWEQALKFWKEDRWQPRWKFCKRADQQFLPWIWPLPPIKPAVLPAVSRGCHAHQANLPTGNRRQHCARPAPSNPPL